MSDVPNIGNPAVVKDQRKRIEDVADLCRAARKRLGTHGAFRARILLDMILLELGKELVRPTDETRE